MQDQDLTQKVEQLINIDDTEVDPELYNQDVDLIPSTQ